MFIPAMGTIKPAGVASALFTPVQQRVLGLLFGQPERRFQSAQIIRLAQSGTGAVHRQLRRLERAGLVTVTRVGNQRHYQANRDSPIFADLHGLITRTTGLVGPLRESLEGLGARITAAFVFGSVAAGRDTASSDIDLMVISDLVAHAELFEALQPAEHRLGRAVNPVLLTIKNWRNKRDGSDSFAHRVGSAPKLFVIGGESDIA